MNYLQAIKFGSYKLKLNNIESHILDSELLLSFVLKSSREQILTKLNSNIEKKNFEEFKKILSRREKKEPIAYITNKKEFWKNNFYVNNHVLIPRPETELIVEEVLKNTEINSSKSFLEVGTGSGCIIISILKERVRCSATAIDICKKALKIAKFNAKMHHLKNNINFINIDIDKIQDNKYDFIISNPPYISKNSNLDESLKYEPHIALYSKNDGLADLSKIIADSRKYLHENGVLMLEHGMGQEAYLQQKMMKEGFKKIELIKDLKDINRFIIGYG